MIWSGLDEQLMDYWEECDRIRDKKFKEEMKLKEKNHPILTEIGNVRIWIARKVLGI